MEYWSVVRDPSLHNSITPVLRVRSEPVERNEAYGSFTSLLEQEE
jgi:hypothetical protein